ncbi:hypothetical protein [Pseudoduganella namucuonensis]|uniref:Gel scht n=1 Tax=Pseudoduganella namucuonensis TaxID=1035707 RepID=A0A1I7JUJ4_9BURK|nr:hypothetical protein [Pseudoduganella namucuonensis]SFU88838.1 hypothetical protein SAMN05216552_101325 [Pseudoduganella namucuonensis]
MNTTLRTIACAIAWTGMACAYAEPQTATGTETVQVQVPASYRLAPGEFDEYAYTYQLDNGKRIKFTQRVRTYYTQLEGEPKVQLLAVAPGHFVTPSGARIAFTEEGATVGIRNYERLALGTALPENTHMMAAR